MDPVSVLCQSHDLVLWGRVLDYTPTDLDRLLHEERQFFDYGAGLMIYPIEELPHWQLHMKRICREERWAAFANRQYGPYTLPVLFGDRLVARMDAKLERGRNSLRINGLWLESWFEPTPKFGEAFAKGLDRLMTFLEVDQLEGETWLP